MHSYLPKLPVPVNDWAPIILDATKHGDICPQPFTHFGNWTKDENCLFLNIYVPGTYNFANFNWAELDKIDKVEKKSTANIKNCEKLAVITYIPGGAFFIGSGNSDW